MTYRRLAIGGVLLFIAALYAVFRALGYPAGLFCTAFVGGFVLWLRTLQRQPIDPHVILLPHLVTVILFIAHVYEEYRAHIEIFMSKFTGIAVTQTNFLTIAAFIAPMIWLTGLVLALRRRQFGYFLICVFYFGMMFGEPMHFVFPFIENGTFHYVAGMYTAALPSIAGWSTFLILVRETRRARRGQSVAAR
jgi:hypothetical protein